MIVRKLLWVFATSLCLLAHQAHAKDPGRAEAAESKSDESEILNGVINDIDHAKGRLVISDTAYHFSPLKLVVHAGDRVSGVISLRPSQEIRYKCLPQAGTSLAATRTITEIWIGKN